MRLNIFPLEVAILYHYALASSVPRGRGVCRDDDKDETGLCAEGIP